MSPVAAFMFDVNAIRSAIEQRGMFECFDNTEALKLDIYPRELIAGELDHSQVVEVFDLPACEEQIEAL